MSTTNEYLAIAAECPDRCEDSNVCYACLAVYDAARGALEAGVDRDAAVVLVELHLLEVFGQEGLSGNERRMVDAAYA